MTQMCLSDTDFKIIDYYVKKSNGNIEHESDEFNRNMN